MYGCGILLHNGEGDTCVIQKLSQGMVPPLNIISPGERLFPGDIIYYYVIATAPAMAWSLIGLSGSLIETVSANRLIGVLLAKHYELVAPREAVRMVCEIAAPDAYGMYFSNILGLGHQRGHRTERVAPEIHVEPPHDNPYPLVGQPAPDFPHGVGEELRLSL